MATFYEGIDLRECRFPVKNTGEVKWAYTSLWRSAARPGHNGIDIGSSHYPYYQTCYGWQLIAIMDGFVSYGYDGVSGYTANLVTAYGTFVYCHMQKPSGVLNRRVKAGDIIGYIGTSPNVPAHVHFIWFQNGKDRDPIYLLDAIAKAQWDTHIPTGDIEVDVSELNAALLAQDTRTKAYLEVKFAEVMGNDERLRDEQSGLIRATDEANDVVAEQILKNTAPK